jgi:hypothetical protein
MEGRKDVTGYLVEAMTSLSLAEREHITPRDAKQLFVSFCRTPGAKRVLCGFKEQLKATTSHDAEAAVFLTNKEQLTRWVTDVVSDVAAAQALKDKVQEIAVSKTQAARMKLQTNTNLLNDILRHEPAGDLEGSRHRRERLLRKLTKVSELLPGFRPGYGALFRGPASPPTLHQALATVTSRTAELKSKFGCLIDKTAKERPSSKIPTAAGNSRPIHFSIQISNSGAFQAHQLDSIQHILSQGYDYRDMLVERFAQMTYLVCGTGTPFPWWPELLRIAACGLMLE